MRIREYLPELYDDNEEMQALAYSEELEFENNLKNSITNSFNDNFIKIATINGIEKYEKIFGIVADPSTESISFRRQRVLSKLLNQIPFTERYLQAQLDIIIGPNQWTYTMDYDNYTLNIFITVPGRSWLTELYNFIDRIIPCNLVTNVNIFAASWQQVKESFTNWQNVKDVCGTWQDVIDAEWLV